MKVIFAGTPQFAADALAALLKQHQVVAVLTQPDRPSGRGMRMTPSPVKQLALKHQLPVLQPDTLKSAEIQQRLETYDSDVMVVAAYGLILPKTVLQTPRHGCINIHASLLPRWRGAAPIQRAILAGDTETGITIMQMDEGLDSGDMLLRHTCPIDSNDTASSLHDKLAILGTASILEGLQLLKNVQLTPSPQDNDSVTYAAKILKSEGRIDWSKDASQIAREVRAFNPFPVSHTTFNEAPIKIFQATPINLEGAASEVLAVNKQGITVACGKNALRLEVLLRPGSKAQPAAQFIQAVPVKPGDHFS